MNIRRIIAGISAVCVIGAVMPSVAVIADNAVITASAEGETTDYTEGTYGALIYRNYGDYIEISGCYESSVYIVIPSEIDGLPVTSIGNSAFSDCSDLTSVVISNGITNIGYGAFYNCVCLTEIKIPDSVTVIGEIAFYDCSDLKSVTIPDSVTIIGNYAFSGCSDLASVTILNPECDIYDNKNTISETASICGYDNSTAQAYAEKYNKTFESIGSAPVKEVSMGDIDGDGKINASDASFILTEYSLISTSGAGTFTEDMKNAADVNKDGLIDSVDSSLILSYYTYTSTGGTDTIEKYLESLGK